MHVTGRIIEHFRLGQGLDQLLVIPLNLPTPLLWFHHRCLQTGHTTIIQSIKT